MQTFRSHFGSFFCESEEEACREEATEMAAKYLHKKKSVFNNLKKITHYYNNGFEEDIHNYIYTLYIYIYIYI